MPHIVAEELFALLSSGEFYVTIFNSLWKILLSFFVALTLGALFAVLSATFSPFEKILYPVVVSVRAAPTMSVIFLCLIWFDSKISPMIVSLMVTFPILYTSCLSAIKSCDKRLLEMAKVYSVPKKTVIGRLYLPFVADKVYLDSVSTLSLNVKLIIAAEALASTNLSLGLTMQVAKANLETARLFAVTVVAILLSVLLELLLKLIRSIVRRKPNAANN